MDAAAISGLLALMLSAALLGGTAAERVRMPRLVGWLAAGLALRWALLGLESAGAGPAGALLHAGPEVLDFLKDLSLTAVMFTIGLAFELDHLRRLGKTFLWLALAQAGGAAGLTFAATLLVGQLAGASRPVLTSVFLAVIAVSISPAATLLTLRQYGAKGVATETLLAVTGLSAVLAIGLFDLSVIVLGKTGAVALVGGAAGTMSAAAWVLSATGGSVLAGAALGVLLALLHGRIALHREAKVVLAAVLGLLALSGLLKLDPLLGGLLAGVVFVNVAHDPGRMEERLAVLGGPLFALLFTIAGFKLQLGVLAERTVLLLAGAYVVARSAGKILAVRLLLSRRTGGDLRPGAGLGLLCHAAVAVGLAGRLGLVLEPEAWVRQLQSAVVGAVVVFELSGPLLLKRTIVAAGEVKAFRLFHLPAPPLGAWGRLRDGALSLLRRLGVVGLPRPEVGPIRARHVMHVNVKVLRAGAGLDEVLHFIERSRLDHFPVVDEGGRFIGTINLADVRDIIYDPQLRNLVDAQDLLEDEQVTAGPDETLEELFEKLSRHRARDLIVLDVPSRAILGIVEQRDVLRAMHVEQTGRTPGAGH